MIDDDATTGEERKLPPDADQIHATLRDTATAHLAKDGCLYLSALVWLDSGVCFPIVGQTSGEEQEKDAIVEMIRLITIALPTKCVTISMEAWMVDMGDVAPGTPYVRPSQSDRRQEVVTLSCEWSGGARTSWIYRIERDNAGNFARLGFRDEYSGAELDGRFTDLVAPAEMVTSEQREVALYILRERLGPMADKVLSLARNDSGSAKMPADSDDKVRPH